MDEKNLKKKKKTNCECCLHYEYDDECDAYICTLDLDEDEIKRIENCTNRECPYFDFFDEYKLVQKQN